MQNIIAMLMSTVLAPKRDEEGATATEYAILVALVAAAVIAAVALFGTQLSAAFTGLIPDF